MLYYTLTDAGAEGLYAKRLPDGEEELAVKDRIGERGFAVFADGVYYLHPRGDRRAPYDSMIAPFQNSDEAYDIRFYDFATRTTRSVADIEGAVHLGLAVSTDRTSFLFSKVIDSGSELMMIENFR
jgi:hypothetical protein